MKKIAIVGAGGFGREVKMLIDQINKVEKKFDIIGFYDDKEFSAEINGLPYLGKVDDLNLITEETSVAIAVGKPVSKRNILNRITNKLIDYPNLIHPSVIIGDFVDFGEGNIVCAGNIITVNVRIGNFVILNLGCTVGHDTIINDYCSFMPSVNISGVVVIDESVYVGTGAKIIDSLSIGKNTVVGASSCVVKSLPENCLAVGVPAKPIKFFE